MSTSPSSRSCRTRSPLRPSITRVAVRASRSEGREGFFWLSGVSKPRLDLGRMHWLLVALTLLTLSCASRTSDLDYCVELCEGRGATLESVAWIDGEVSCFCRLPEE